MGYTNQVYSSNEIMTKEGSSKIVNFMTALFKCVLCLGTAVYVSNLGHKLLVIDMINRVDYLIYLIFLIFNCMHFRLRTQDHVTSKLKTYNLS